MGGMGSRELWRVHVCTCARTCSTPSPSGVGVEHAETFVRSRNEVSPGIGARETSKELGEKPLRVDSIASVGRKSHG